MHKLKFLLAILILALVASACGGDDEITATNCFEVVDETMELFQKLIDDIDEEFAGVGIEDFVAQADELEMLSSYEDDARTIEALAESLGCSNEQISAAVSAQAGVLTSETTAGRLVIDALVAGGL